MSIVASIDFDKEPGRSRTAKELYRRGCRPLGKPEGQRLYLLSSPRHSMRNQAWPLNDQEMQDLRDLLHKDKNAALQSDLYYHAQRAGQTSCANLYSSWEKIVEPTEKEAQTILELSFRYGHDFDSWIVSTKEKKTWTVGTSWKRPFKFAEHLRGEWFHGIVKNKKHGQTDYIVIDLDRHSGVIPTFIFIQRLRELRQLLDAEGRAALCQVNPKNGSLHLWIPVQTMPYGMARHIIATWRQKLPWLEGVEIFPDNMHQVILPLRPDKVLLCDQAVPKVKRIGYRTNKLTLKKSRYTVPAYSCTFVWKWLQKPQSAPWETWEEVVAQACKNQPDTSETLEVNDQPRRKNKKMKKVAMTDMGSFGPFKGKWLRTLIDTYVNGVRPPDNTIGIIEQGIIRYCMVGKGLNAEETRSVVKMLRERLPDKSFSDRLLYDEAELDRANEYLLKNPLAYLPDPERSRDIWTKVDAYCNKIGFDIRDPATWKISKPRLELPDNATIMTLAAMVALHMRCSLETARCLLERVAHHVLHKNELAYSLMKKFLVEHGIPGTNTRANKVLKMLQQTGFLILRHKYYHDPVTGYRHGNFFVLSPAVLREEEQYVSTISLLPNLDCSLDEDYDKLTIWIQSCDKRFYERLEELFAKKIAA